MANNQNGFDFQPYITPYAGSPIKEFEGLGKVLNERYEKNIADWDNADFLLNTIKVLDTSKGFKDKARSDIDNTMKSIIESGRYEDAKPYVREVVKRLRNDPNLLTSQENYKKAMELEAKVADMALKGKTPLAFRDYKKEEFDEQGNVRSLNTTGAVEEQLDYRPKMEELFNNVQPDGGGYSSSGIDERNGLIYQVGSGSTSSYITKDKIIQIAKNSMSGFLSTDEGRQRMRVLVEKGGYDPKEAYKILENEVIGVGLERVFNRTQTENTSSLVGGASQLRGTTDEPEKPIYNLIDKVETVDDSPVSTSYGKPEFQDVWSEAFTSKTPEGKSKAQFALTNTLSNLADSPDAEVSGNAKEWLGVIDKAKKIFGNKADDYLQAVVGGDSNLKTAAISNSGKSLSEIAQLEKEVRKLNNKSRGFIFDTKFEDKVEEALAQKIALNVGWITPNYLDMPDGVKGRIKSAVENFSLDNFDIVRGADKDLSKLKNRAVTITRISNGPIGGGKGIGYLIKDSEGEEHVAVPKANIYGNQITLQMARAFGAPELIIRDRFAKGISAEGQVRSLEQVFTDNAFDINNSNLVDPSIKGHSIRKLSDKEAQQAQMREGFELIKNGRPITLKDMISDVSNLDRATLTEMAQFAINDGLVTQSQIIKGQDRLGFIIDEAALLNAIQKSNKPHRFANQYQIYESFLKK